VPDFLNRGWRFTAADGVRSVRSQGTWNFTELAQWATTANVDPVAALLGLVCSLDGAPSFLCICGWTRQWDHSQHDLTKLCGSRNWSLGVVKLEPDFHALVMSMVYIRAVTAVGVL